MAQYKAKAFEPEQQLVQDLGGGIDLSKPSTTIANDAFSDLLNLQYFQHLLRVDTGYLQYRQSPLLGIPMGQFQFLTRAGAVFTLLITTLTLYKDNGTQWEFTGSGTGDDYALSDTAAGSNAFTLTSGTGYVIGQNVGVRLSDGTQLLTSVTGIAGTALTTLDTVPVGLTAMTGGDVVIAAVFTGTSSIQPTGLTWAALDIFIFTNGVDVPWAYDGTDVIPLGGSPPVCRTLQEFHGFLLLANTSDGGGAHPQRVVNSDLDDPTNWTTGLSGFVDLQDTEDAIFDMEPLGPWLIIYRESSLMRRTYIGSLAQLFFDEYTVQGIGVPASVCVADTGASHVLVGDTGIFRYTGGYDLEDVGEKIYDSVWGPKGDFNNTLSSQMFAFYVAELDEVWIFYPTQSSKGFCDKLLRYNQEKDSWFIRQFANEICGFGFLEHAGGRTWDQATQAWQDDPLTWIARAKTDLAPITLLCDAANMRTYVYDYSQDTDNGETISWICTTKDFVSPPYILRLDQLKVRGSGTINVDVSMDAGQSYQTYATFTLGLSPSIKWAGTQIAAESFRFRMSGSDPAFTLDWYQVDYFEETPW